MIFLTFERLLGVEGDAAPRVLVGFLAAGLFFLGWRLLFTVVGDELQWHHHLGAFLLLEESFCLSASAAFRLLQLIASSVAPSSQPLVGLAAGGSALALFVVILVARQRGSPLAPEMAPDDSLPSSDTDATTRGDSRESPNDHDAPIADTAPSPALSARMPHAGLSDLPSPLRLPCPSPGSGPGTTPGPEPGRPRTRHRSTPVPGRRQAPDSSGRQPRAGSRLRRRAVPPPEPPHE